MEDFSSKLALKYARQNGVIIGRVESLLLFLDNLPKDEIKSELIKILNQDEAFMEGLRNETK